MPRILMPRDLEILKFLFENKIATQKQIKKSICPSVSIKTLNRRLNILRKMGVLQYRPYLWENRRCFVYELSPKGFEKYKEDGSFELTKEEFRSDSPTHDLTLVDIVSRFKSFCLVKDVITENALQGYETYKYDPTFREFSDLCNDGVLLLKKEKDEYLIGLEYDRKPKSINRYRRFLQRVYQKTLVNVIFYIVEKDHMMKKIIEIDSRFSRKQKTKIYLTTKEKFFSSTNVVTFMNHCGEFIEVS